MLEYRLPIDEALAAALEDAFCEDYQTHWMLFENELLKTHELRGYFDRPEDAVAVHGALQSRFSILPALPAPLTLEDKDWKEAYKLHFKPWSDRGLHWVPVWERDAYPLPAGDQVVLLDPGMAFGTGNHETTRLCVRRLLDARDRWGAEAVRGKSVIDAGCGSGILAISARKLGFKDCYGFDLDPDSVKISIDNARLCSVEGEVEFLWHDLIDGLRGRTCDVLMANILANVLCAHSTVLLQAVNPGGVLILSGILAREVEMVRTHFAAEAQSLWGDARLTESRIDGDWADVELRR